MSCCRRGYEGLVQILLCWRSQGSRTWSLQNLFREDEQQEGQHEVFQEKLHVFILFVWMQTSERVTEEEARMELTAQPLSWWISCTRCSPSSLWTCRIHAEVVPARLPSSRWRCLCSLLHSRCSQGDCFSDHGCPKRAKQWWDISYVMSIVDKRLCCCGTHLWASVLDYLLCWLCTLIFNALLVGIRS